MRYVAWLLITAVTLAIACFVWPTRYRYDHAGLGAASFIVRFDRFSDRAQVFNPVTKAWVQ